MAILGQKGPTTAGTPVVLSSTAVGAGKYLIWAHPANTGSYMYLGYTSQTATSAAGAVLKKSDFPILLSMVDIADLWVDSDTDADTICWVLAEHENVGVHAPHVTW